LPRTPSEPDNTTGRPPGALLRQWRERRRLTQQQLAAHCGIPVRELNLIEAGHVVPGPSLLLLLGHRLDLPLRESNMLLSAAGHAGGYPENPLDSPPMTMVDAAVRKVLTAHEPYPAFAVDRSWDLVASNTTVRLFTDGVPAELLAPPMNMLRLLLHPDGLASRLINRQQWTGYLLGALRREISRNDDEKLDKLHEELAGYPGPPPGRRMAEVGTGVVVPLGIRHRGVDCALFCASSLFGAALDVTVSELTIESFFPADTRTAEVLRTDSPEPDAAHSWWWSPAGS
jgi:transcriptional regulator with XRE-family HTH domain